MPALSVKRFYNFTGKTSINGDRALVYTAKMKNKSLPISISIMKITELQNKSTISLKRNGSQQQQGEKKKKRRSAVWKKKKKKTARTKITIQRAGEGRESNERGRKKECAPVLGAACVLPTPQSFLAL